MKEFDYEWRWRGGEERGEGNRTGGFGPWGMDFDSHSIKRYVLEKTGPREMAAGK